MSKLIHSKIKFLFLLILMILFMIIFCSCTNKDISKISGKNNEKTEATQNIIQEKVVEVTYSDFDFYGNADHFKKYNTIDFGGCSAVKTFIDGKTYVGRNYDWYCGESPAFIVKNNAGKFKTIGIASSSRYFKDWKDNYVLTDDELSYLPYLCTDVMSEAGIYASTNVRIQEDGLECVCTNLGKQRFCTYCFMQIMLSEYDSIEEIINHIDDYDWFDVSTLGFLQSFMLVDKNGDSVVIEFAKNSYKINRASCNSNYFIDNEYYKDEKYPLGEMRISKELEYLPYVRTTDDIFKMMKLGSYAQFYTKDVEVDYAISENMKELGYTRFNIEENREEARKKMNDLLKAYGTYSWEDLINKSCWETVFCNVANISDLTFDVHFSEHYDIKFKVAFE